MGTRTYSRRRSDGTRVLTAAGRARAGNVGAAVLDIFGDVIGDDGLPATAPAVVTVPPPTPATPPVTPPPTTKPVWIGKRQRGFPVPLDGKFDDANDPVAKAANDALQTLASIPTSQLSPVGRQLAQAWARNGNGSFQQLLNILDTHDAMAVIYEMRGWNAPATVESWTDITSGKTKTPLLTTEDTNEPIMFFRGVNASSGNKTKKVSAARKQADLRSGREHFVGFGVHGEGTYAAGATANGTGKSKGQGHNSARSAMSIANGYGRTIVVFGLKKGSNVRFGRPTGTVDYRDMLRDASTLVGQQVHNVGLAATILGYDAYRATSGNSDDYWVVLNRSAMVISKTNGKYPNWQTGN